MGKHRKPAHACMKRTAAVSVLSIGASATMAGQANAADISLAPGININVDQLHTMINQFAPAALPSIAKIPNLADVPGVADFIPEVLEQARQGNYAAIAEIPTKKLPVEGQRIVDVAATKIGSPYVWGAAGPNAFDCSGLTSWAYAQVGKHIPRTSYAQAVGGTPVAYQDLQAGDIVAFYAGASHVGIYTGHGTVINAVDYGTPLSETPLARMPFHSAVRY